MRESRSERTKGADYAARQQQSGAESGSQPMRDALEFHKLPPENVTNLPHAGGVFQSRKTPGKALVVLMRNHTSIISSVI
jgi:hypothetical protein